MHVKINLALVSAGIADSYQFCHECCWFIFSTLIRGAINTELGSYPSSWATAWTDPAELSTPAHTDAETETETEADALSPSQSPTHPVPLQSLHSYKGGDNLVQIEGSSSAGSEFKARQTRPKHGRYKSMSKHDLTARYFRKDVVGFKNIDLLR